MTVLLRAKDVRNFLQTVESFTDKQVKVVDVDWDQLDWIDLNVKPNVGPYRGAEYPFRVKPHSMDVTVKSKLLHPNISDGKLCMIFDDVKESSTLEAAVLAILYLLHHPDYFYAYGEFRQCVPEYEGYTWVRLSLTGRQIVKFKGPKYIEDDEEIEMILDDLEIYRLSQLVHNGRVLDEEFDAFWEEKQKRKRCDKVGDGERSVNSTSGTTSEHPETVITTSEHPETDTTTSEHPETVITTSEHPETDTTTSEHPETGVTTSEHSETSTTTPEHLETAKSEHSELAPLTEIERDIYKKMEMYEDITELFRDPTAVMPFLDLKQPCMEQKFQASRNYSEPSELLKKVEADFRGLVIQDDAKNDSP